LASVLFVSRSGDTPGFVTHGPSRSSRYKARRPSTQELIAHHPDVEPIREHLQLRAIEFGFSRDGVGVQGAGQEINIHFQPLLFTIRLVKTAVLSLGKNTVSCKLVMAAVPATTRW